MADIDYMLIDTHCHLHFKDFDIDRNDVIKRAAEKNIGYIINVGSGTEGNKRSLELAREYDAIYASVGAHPHDASSIDDFAISLMGEMVREEKVVAIGEMGLDYYKNISPKDVQISVFRKFVRLSKELGLPLIIHNREANEDTLDVVREELGRDVKGVMHCFSGDENFLGLV